MFETAEKCMDRPRIQDAAEFKVTHDVLHDRVAIQRRIRAAFEEEAPAASAPARTANRPAPLASGREFSKELRHVRHVLRHPRYLDVDVNSVLNTFAYMFDRHQRGIWVSIRNNRVRDFLTFANKDYKNPLARFLKLDPSLPRALVHNTNPRTFTNFDCLVGNVYHAPHQQRAQGFEPIYNHLEARYFLDLVCAERRVPDCDFFFNLFDQLLLREDMMVPSLHVTGGRLVPIPEFAHKKMCPIVSFCCAPGYLDLPFIFPDDVQRASGLFFPPRCANPLAEAKRPADHRRYTQADHRRSRIETDWNKKLSAGVFRGSATGCGWTIEDNPRLKAAHVSLRARDGLLDAKLTGTHEVRFKKRKGHKYVQFQTDARVVPSQKPENALSLEEQSKFKYIVDLPGNVVAYRLSTMFFLRSLMVIVPHEHCRPWFYPHLQHGRNCLFTRVDDLADTLKWCQQHDAKCKRMCDAGYEMCGAIFTESAMLDYVALLLAEISRNTLIAVPKKIGTLDLSNK